jgi:hypothetical protein
MANKGAKKQAVGWTASALVEADLKKVKKKGFLAESTEVLFPSTEVIPTSPPGFWVMFLAFLLRGFSLPAHEFLRGLLFVYGVQLHQLMPNSLLHVACFIMMSHRTSWETPRGRYDEYNSKSSLSYDTKV